MMTRAPQMLVAGDRVDLVTVVWSICLTAVVTGFAAGAYLTWVFAPRIGGTASFADVLFAFAGGWIGMLVALLIGKLVVDVLVFTLVWRAGGGT